MGLFQKTQTAAAPMIRVPVEGWTRLRDLHAAIIELEKEIVALKQVQFEGSKSDLEEATKVWLPLCGQRRAVPIRWSRRHLHATRSAKVVNGHTLWVGKSMTRKVFGSGVTRLRGTARNWVEATEGGTIRLHGISNYGRDVEIPAEDFHKIRLFVPGGRQYVRRLHGGLNKKPVSPEAAPNYCRAIGLRKQLADLENQYESACQSLMSRESIHPGHWEHNNLRGTSFEGFSLHTRKGGIFMKTESTSALRPIDPGGELFRLVPSDASSS